MPVNTRAVEIACKSTQKKQKIMAFFETPALLRAREGQHQPSPTMPQFHVSSPFPTSDPRSYPILEVSQFEYLELILDPKLTMHLATVEAIRRASPGQALALAVSYSLCFIKLQLAYAERDTARAREGWSQPSTPSSAPVNSDSRHPNNRPSSHSES